MSSIRLKSLPEHICGMTEGFGELDKVEVLT